LLDHGDRAKAPRQRTLRALIDWSYDLLSPTEQSLLRSLSVFQGTFDLESVERVCGRGELNADVLAALSALLDKSLIVRNAHDGRYRLLDTIRQYARDRLEESGEGFRMRALHRQCYLAFSEAARAGILGDRQSEWLAKVDVERDNLIAAHENCDDNAAAIDEGFELAHALKLYWINRGLLGIGYRMLQDALRRDSPPSRLRTRALFDVGQLAYFMGRYEEACVHLQRSLELATEMQSQERIAAVLQPLGMAYLALGKIDLAREQLERAVVLSRRLNYTRDLAAALNALAQLERSQSNLSTARTLYEDVLSIARSAGDRESAAIALLNLSMTSITAGERAHAAAPLREALKIAEEMSSAGLIQAAFDVATGLAAARGDERRAALWLGVAERLMKETGLQRDPADQVFLAPLVDAARRSSGSRFEGVMQEGAKLAMDRALSELRGWLSGS